MAEQSEHASDAPTPGRPQHGDVLTDAVVARAASGDEDAVRLLYRALQPRMLNYLRALVGETDAEDVASETWSRITRDLRTFCGTSSDFRAWTVTIARHRAIDHLRRKQPSSPLPPNAMPHWPASNDTERDAIDGIATTSALALVAALPPDQAQAILLRVVIGLDAATAGRILGKRPGAIRTAAYRGLQNLAKRLQPSDPGQESEVLRFPRATAVTASPRSPSSARNGLKEAT